MKCTFVFWPVNIFIGRVHLWDAKFHFRGFSMEDVLGKHWPDNEILF